jgi:ribonuclease BN (tRNA processing enzyme)
MDAGNGTLAELQRHVTLGELDAIVLSHYHPDHTADMYPFFFEQLLAQRPPVRVFTPPGVRARLGSLIGDDSRARFDELIDWREVAADSTFEVGPLRFETFDAAHSAPNNTLRVSDGARTLCFSGDTGPNEHLARAARDADLFLCEASWTNEQSGIMAPIHLTAGEAGAAARAAGAARLMLTHIWPVNDLDTMRAQASETFGAGIELALETETTKV